MSEKLPNIVLILSDDHGVGAVGAYGAPNRCTPNIDRLSAGGLQLDRAFCTNAICTPSRAALLTGKYSHRNGVPRFNTLVTDQAMLPRELKRAGYTTAVFGKWHLGANPGDAGFEKWDIIDIQGDYTNPQFRRPDGLHRYRGHTTNIITELALDYLDNHDGNQPFFLCVHHKAPHGPFTPRPEDAGLWENREIELPASAEDTLTDRSNAVRRYQSREPGSRYEGPSIERGAIPLEQTRKKLRAYLECCEGLDASVGQILEKIRELDLSENTLVIYTSDHGLMTGQHGFFDKRLMYEDSIRIPCILHWPKAVKTGFCNSDLILNVDLAPTVLEIAGLPVPSEMQGHSFAGLFRGEELKQWRTSFYYRYYGQETYRDQFIPAQIGVRTRDAKLIYFPETGEFEFYDLATDPDERHNAYGKSVYTLQCDTLKKNITRLRNELGDNDQFASLWTDLIEPNERPGESYYEPWPF